MASTRLYVGNLSYSTTEEDLRSAFGSGGRQVTDVFIVTDRETGRPRGFAFVEMGSDADAKSAVSDLDGADIGGRQLKVNEAAERVERNNDRGGDRERKPRGYDRGGAAPRGATRGYGSSNDRTSEQGSRGNSREADRGKGRDEGSRPRRGARDGDRKSRDF